MRTPTAIALAHLETKVGNIDQYVAQKLESAHLSNSINFSPLSKSMLSLLPSATLRKTQTLSLATKRLWEKGECKLDPLGQAFWIPSHLHHQKARSLRRYDARFNRHRFGEAKALKLDPSISEAGAKSIEFASLMHNLIDQMLLSLKAEAAVPRSLELPRNGEKPVIPVAKQWAHVRKTLETFPPYPPA